MSTFKKASKKSAKLRLALIGPSGSGKTLSALKIARGLVGPKGRIAVLDTEHGSASKYADKVDFDVVDLESFAPAEYVRILGIAGREGFDAVVIDSLSHAWMGKGGALEQVDNAAKRSQGNSFAAWRDVTPQHNALVEAMLRCPAHLLVTMRAKTEYVLESVQANGKTKQVPRKVGLAPIQRDGLEYEFDVVADMDLEHHFMVSKTRCSALDQAVIQNPGDEVAEALLAWLRGAPEEPAPAPRPAPPASPAPRHEEPAKGPDTDPAPAADADGEVPMSALEWFLSRIRAAEDAADGEAFRALEKQAVAALDSGRLSRAEWAEVGTAWKAAKRRAGDAVAKARSRDAELNAAAGRAAS